MYRRYYQGYNPSDQNPQRPIGQDQYMEEQEGYGAQGDESERTEIANAGEPEIIVPERPVHISNTDRKPFPSFPLFNNSKGRNIFANFGKDDLIILALIFIFLMDGIEDNLLLLVLVFIFFAGLNT